MYTGPSEEDAGDAPLREERARAARRERRDRVSWTIIGWVMAAALALLTYDSGGAALDAHRAGRPWLYPACVSVSCLLVLLWLTVQAVRRRRDRVSDRGPG